MFWCWLSKMCKPAVVKVQVLHWILALLTWNIGMGDNKIVVISHGVIRRKLFLFKRNVDWIKPYLKTSILMYSAMESTIEHNAIWMD